MGSTPGTRPWRQCFSSEAVWPPKGTKMETVREVEEWVARTQNVWPGGCGGTVSQERSKIIIVILDCCCHRDVGGETDASHYRVSFLCS